MTEGNVYWAATALLALLYMASTLTYLTKRTQVQAFFVDLGYPTYLIPVLIVAKIFAVFAILTRVSVALSDFVYAGMFYHLLLAVLAHFGIGRVRSALPAALGLVLIAISFLTQNAARHPPSPYAPESTTYQSTLH